MEVSIGGSQLNGSCQSWSSRFELASQLFDVIRSVFEKKTTRSGKEIRARHGFYYLDKRTPTVHHLVLQQRIAIKNLFALPSRRWEKKLCQIYFRARLFSFETVGYFCEDLESIASLQRELEYIFVMPQRKLLFINGLKQAHFTLRPPLLVCASKRYWSWKDVQSQAAFKHTIDAIIQNICV